MYLNQEFQYNDTDTNYLIDDDGKTTSLGIRCKLKHQQDVLLLSGWRKRASLHPRRENNLAKTLTKSLRML